jgi:DeoR/GlpR family transcriptional regulator of sugar metabolism
MQNLASMSRRDIIETRLADGQAIVASSIAAEFCVSEDAVRRDLRLLAAEGKCRRVYGGALPVRGGNLSLSERIGYRSEEKATVARSAASTIKPGEFVFIDTGSTNLAMVDYLPLNSDVRWATNSIDIAAAIMQRRIPNLVLIGGAINSAIGGSVDAAAVLTVRNLHIDRCFIGACAVLPNGRIGVHSHDDAIFKRALIAQSAMTIALITADKINERATFEIGDSAQIETLVVEANQPFFLTEKLVTYGYSLLGA